MGELRLVATLLRHLIDTHRSSAQVSRALIDWGETNASWLAGKTIKDVTVDLGWIEKMAKRAAKAGDADDALATLTASLGDMLQLGEFDRRLLLYALVFERRPRANALALAMARAQVDMAAMIGIAIGPAVIITALFYYWNCSRTDFAVLFAALWLISDIAIGFISPLPLPHFLIGLGFVPALLVGIVLHWQRFQRRHERLPSPSVKRS